MGIPCNPLPLQFCRSYRLIGVIHDPWSMILDSWRWVIQAPKTWAGLQTFNWWPTPKMTDPTAGWPHKLQTRPQWLVASSSLAKGAKHGWSRSWIRDFSAQSAATWGVLRYVSFNLFFFFKSPLDAKGRSNFTHIFFGVGNHHLIFECFSFWPFSWL